MISDWCPGGRMLRTAQTVAARVNTSPSIVSTAPKWGLCPCTLHGVQPYFPLPMPIVPISYSFSKTKLSTCNLGIIHIPVTTITHCSPLTIVVDLYNTRYTWTCSIRLECNVLVKPSCRHATLASLISQPPGWLLKPMTKSNVLMHVKGLNVQQGKAGVDKLI
jgi:hypothetical protein